jgi:limonene-1,2-epoxide hydrolase
VSGQDDGNPTPTPADVVRRFIASFIAAWPTGDAASLGSFFAEDAVYHNVPMTPVHGRQAIVDTFAEFMGMGGQVAVDVTHMVCEGPIVMTERVDHFSRDGTTVSLPLMGVIEMHDGLITAWRDYFDMGQLAAQLNRSA